MNKTPSQHVEEDSMVIVASVVRTSYLVVLTLQASVRCFIKTRVFIPKGNHCCRVHLLKNQLFGCVISTSMMESSDRMYFTETVSMKAGSSILYKVGDFSMSEEQL